MDETYDDRDTTIQKINIVYLQCFSTLQTTRCERLNDFYLTEPA